MAYVAITGELVNRIEGRIKVMRNNEVNSMCPELTKDYLVDASHIYNLSTWGAEHVHLMNTIPKDWLAQQPDAYVNITGDHQVDGQHFASIKKQIRFNKMTNAYARPSRDYWNRTSGEIHIDEIRALPDGMAGKDECIRRFDEACTESEIDRKWALVAKDITDFLKRCKSLNEAMKLLPTLRMYVAPEDIERLEKKVERAPRRELVLDVDAEGITAAAVAARLMSAV